MLTAFIYAVFGGQCHLYIQLKEYLEVLQLPTVALGADATFTKLYIARHTWAIIAVLREYFSNRMQLDALEQDPIPYPEALLDDLMVKARNKESPLRGDFPWKWKQAFTETAEGHGTTPAATGSNLNPMPAMTQEKLQKHIADQANAAVKKALAGRREEQERWSLRDLDTALPDLSHVHPVIKQRLEKFHKKFKGYVPLGRICETGGQKTLDDLPKLDRYTRNNKSTMCYNHVCGVCKPSRARKCNFTHVSKEAIPDEFARAFLEVIEAGGGLETVYQEGPSHAGQKRR